MSDPAALNAQLLVQAEEDIAGIQNMLGGEPVQNMCPLGIAAGGSGNAFNAKDYKFFSNSRQIEAQTTTMNARSICYGLGLEARA